MAEGALYIFISEKKRIQTSTTDEKLNFDGWIFTLRGYSLRL